MGGYFSPKFGCAFATALCLASSTIASQLPSVARACGPKTAAQGPGGIVLELPSYRVVDDLTIQDNDSIPIELRDQVTSTIKQHQFTDTAYSSWTDELERLALSSLQDQGFFRAAVTVFTNLLAQDKQRAHYFATVIIEAGPQYRLGQVRFRDNHVFSSDELRKLIRLQTDDVFEVSKIREGVEAIGKKYGEIGYIDVTTEAQTEIQDDTSRISLTLVLIEDKQYVVGTVTVLTEDPHIRDVVQSTFISGEIFSSAKWRDFFEKNKSVLPSDANEQERLEVRRDMPAATVALTLDFRPCPWRSSERLP
jgi:hypothetical protein